MRIHATPRYFLTAILTLAIAHFAQSPSYGQYTTAGAPTWNYDASYNPGPPSSSSTPPGWPSFGDFSRWDRNSLDLEWLLKRSNYSPTYTTFCFPPTPPALRSKIDPSATNQRVEAAPAYLANFIYEPFYAPLSTRLYEKNLSNKLQARLEDYRIKRNALRAELLLKLESLRSASTEDRLQQLDAFARVQTPGLRELESQADQLRVDLLRSGLVGFIWGTGSWYECRAWRLSDSQSMQRELGNNASKAMFYVLRSAVFYQEGLSPAQRRLLREVTIELQENALATIGDKPSNEQKLFFFSPETTRVAEPTNVPLELTAKITRYQNVKARLKTELRDTMCEFDSAPEATRTRALKQFAERQAPAISALEVLAEEIRVDLAAVPKPEVPAFPSELAARIGAYDKEKRSLQKSLQTQLEEVRKKYAPQSRRFKATVSEDEEAYKLEGSYRVPSDNLSRLRQAVNELNMQYAQDFARLKRENEAIRIAVAEFAASNPATKSESTVPALLSAFLNALRDEEVSRPYKNYQIAVYQPGLSPEQRRLLFEVALEDLALPLPGVEYF